MKRVLLVRPDIKEVKSFSHPVNYRPPYILKYIQALLRREDIFEVDFIDAYVGSKSLSELVSLTCAFSPDILVVSSLPLDTEYTMEYIKRLRRIKPATVIIAVGPGPSSLFELYSREEIIDFVLTGESELKASSIIKKLGRYENLQGLKSYYGRYADRRKPEIVSDLDRLPFPSYTREEVFRYSMIYPLKISRRLRWGHILTSRGCPYRCIFCSQMMRESYGSRCRRRSAGNVVDEIEGLLRLGANIIAFDDDNFTTSKEHVESICCEIKRRGLKIRWIAHARVDEIDYSMLKLMKETGCTLLRFGIESASKRILKILRKTENPHSWLEKSKEIMGQARSLGISVACLFIVGNPTETMEELRETIKSARALSPDIIQVAYFIPFPGSEAFRIFREERAESNVADMYHYKSPSFNLSGMSDYELKKAQELFYSSFLLRINFIIAHLVKHIAFYLSNPSVFAKYFLMARRVVFSRLLF